ncbi:hypothetical protein ACS0TY_026360 [Phlomoides rotata]
MRILTGSELPKLSAVASEMRPGGRVSSERISIYFYYVMSSFGKSEKILVNVNSGAGSVVFFQSTCHPLKRIGEEATKTRFSCEREVLFWSIDDLIFSYNVSSSETVGGMLLQSPSLHDYDEREMFCFYLYPMKRMSNKVRAISIVCISFSLSSP